MIIDLTNSSDEDVVLPDTPERLENFSRKWQSSTSSQMYLDQLNEQPYVMYEVDTFTNSEGLSTIGSIMKAYAFDRISKMEPRYMPKDVFGFILESLKLGINAKAVQRLNTDIFIPDEVKFILAFGPKFSIPIPFNEKAADLLLYGIRQLNRFHLAVYEERVISAIAKTQIGYIKKNRARYTNDMQRFILHCYNCTLRFFDENADHVIAMADKGNITIIMKKNEYIKKVEEHLSDKDTYTPIVTSCKIGYEKKNMFFLEQLVKLKLINRNELPIIQQGESKIPNMYGLIKMHKPDRSIRPVVNTRSGPGYRLAKVLADIFSHAQERGKYNVNNSMDVAERLSHLIPNPDEVFATFDIKSMFTNISIDMAIKSVTVRYRDGRIKTCIPLTLLIDILRFVIGHATEIEFNAKLYKQKRGLKMGSSLSTILADFVVEDILDVIFLRIQRPKLFTKYVDDCLTLARPAHIKVIENALNAACLEIEFVCEMEDKNGYIIYLDMRILNTKQFALVTKWYQKPMASGRFLNYNSTHPISTIINTARCYVYNMFNLSDAKYTLDMHRKADRALTINDFPANVREKIIAESFQKFCTEKFCQKMYQNTLTVNDSDPYDGHRIFKPTRMLRNGKTSYTTLPFYPEITPTIQKEVRLFNSSLRTTGRPMSTMKRMFDRHKRLNNESEIGPAYVKFPAAKRKRGRRCT